MQKNFKTFQMFQFPGWMEKKLQTLEFQQIHEMQVASKKVYWKNNTECSKHLEHITIEKDIFQNLTDAFFKYL